MNEKTQKTVAAFLDLMGFTGNQLGTMIYNVTNLCYIDGFLDAIDLVKKGDLDAARKALEIMMKEREAIRESTEK